MARLIAALVLALGVAGCASVPPPAPAGTQAGLSENWILQGRLGMRTEEDSLSGQVTWQHTAGVDEVLLTSPLGQGVARIVLQPGGALLEVPNQEPRRAPDAEALTRSVLGYGLPVSGMVWWIQARPAPGSAFEATRDDYGRFTQLRQDGWVIDYLQYADDAPLRPRKLVVAREGLQIRLVADTWQDK